MGAGALVCFSGGSVGFVVGWGMGFPVGVGWIVLWGIVVAFGLV